MAGQGTVTSARSPGRQPTNKGGHCDVSTVTSVAKAGGQPWLAEAPVGYGSAAQPRPIGAQRGTAREAEHGEVPAGLLSPAAPRVPGGAPQPAHPGASRGAHLPAAPTPSPTSWEGGRVVVPWGSTGMEGDQEYQHTALHSNLS